MKFNIIKYTKLWFAISLLLIIPGMISLFNHGLNLGIDFTGGSLLTREFNQQATEQEITKTFEDLKLGTPSIQAVGDTGKVFSIRTKALQPNEVKAVDKALGDKFGGVVESASKTDMVGPIIGKDLTLNAIKALLIASLLILVYITVRFEWRFAVAAVISLLHDVLVVVAFFALFHWEVNSPFVAAILTIIGYSINDTIVIFDRIRENLRYRKKEPIEEIANTSIWQTMARSISTVMTVLFVVVSLLIFGGENIKDFSLALLIGVTSGCYSSIFNASPLWVIFRNAAEKDKNSLQAKTA